MKQKVDCSLFIIDVIVSITTQQHHIYMDLGPKIRLRSILVYVAVSAVSGVITNFVIICARAAVRQS